uniref:Uncharacterized protein n=1 Tax=Arundo donax TaxID=35708 RepID=A0A0A8YV78_ARUDO
MGARFRATVDLELPSMERVATVELEQKERLRAWSLPCREAQAEGASVELELPTVVCVATVEL